MVTGESLLELRPGEIYMAFDGSGKQRPFVVVSRGELNRGNYFLAVPFTTARLEERRNLPNCVSFPRGAFGLDRECAAQTDALTQLQKSDLSTPIERVGTLSSTYYLRLVEAISYSLCIR